MVQTRARHEQGAPGVQDPEIERPDRAARLTVEHHHPARRDAVEALLEGGLADGVVVDLHALAVGQPLHLGHDVLLRVEDHVVGTRAARQLGLVVRGDGADHACAPQLRHLAEEEADTAGGGMHETGVALLQRIRRAREIVRGQTLQHHRGALPRRDSRRKLHEPLRRHDGATAKFKTCNLDLWSS